MPATQGLGRRFVPDARDHRYPIRLMLDPLIAQFFPKGLPQGTRHYRQGPILDQGETGTCVAHAWCGWAYGAPLMTKPFALPTPYNLYREIVKIDEWDDNDHEATAPDEQLQSGTSVRAGVQALRARGHVKNFLRASTTEEIRAYHLAGLGGAVFGVYWTEEMSKPDKQGIIRYSGSQDAVGGHSFKSSGWTDTLRVAGKLHRALRFPNSWDEDWGQKGRAWILEEDLQQLLDDDGDCYVATEQIVVPLPA